MINFFGNPWLDLALWGWLTKVDEEEIITQDSNDSYIEIHVENLEYIDNDIDSEIESSTIISD